MGAFLFILASKFIIMKKAPKRFGYAGGGLTVEGDPNKPLTQKLTPEQWHDLNTKRGNVPYPYGSPDSKGYKQYYDPKKWKVDQDPSTKEVYSTPLDPEYKGYPSVELYNYEYQAPPKTPVTTEPAYYGNVNQKTGKQINYQNIVPLKKAEGGIVRRIMKAPRMNKK